MRVDADGKSGRIQLSPRVVIRSYRWLILMVADDYERQSADDSEEKHRG